MSRQKGAIYTEVASKDDFRKLRAACQPGRVAFQSFDERIFFARLAGTKATVPFGNSVKLGDAAK